MKGILLVLLTYQVHQAFGQLVNISSIPFLLWTQNNPDNYAYQTLTIDNITDIDTTYYNASKTTKIYAHGWSQNGLHFLVLGLKNEYLDAGNDYNIMAVDWRAVANQTYPVAYLASESVGQHVATMIGKILEATSSDLTNWHLIGQSMGAHIVGYAGRNLQSNGYGTPPRITGTDPAGPGYDAGGVNYTELLSSIHLQSTDAAFVDVIHTNGAPLVALGFGIGYSIGTADFYVNCLKTPTTCTLSGQHQPGCVALTDANTYCSHRCAIVYFIDSIQRSQFPACHCTATLLGSCSACGSDAILMGEYVPTSASGDYYLTPSTCNETKYM